MPYWVVNVAPRFQPVSHAKKSWMPDQARHDKYAR